jgi:hypothetical protein
MRVTIPLVSGTPLPRVCASSSTRRVARCKCCQVAASLVISCLFITETVRLLYRITIGCLDSNEHVSRSVVNSAFRHKLVCTLKTEVRRFQPEIATKESSFCGWVKTSQYEWCKASKHIGRFLMHGLCGKETAWAIGLPGSGVMRLLACKWCNTPKGNNQESSIVRWGSLHRNLCFGVGDVTL